MDKNKLGIIVGGLTATAALGYGIYRFLMYTPEPVTAVPVPAAEPVVPAEPVAPIVPATPEPSIDVIAEAAIENAAKPQQTVANILTAIDNDIQRVLFNLNDDDTSIVKLITHTDETLSDMINQLSDVSSKVWVHRDVNAPPETFVVPTHDEVMVKLSQASALLTDALLKIKDKESRNVLIGIVEAKQLQLSSVELIQDAVNDLGIMSLVHAK